MHKAFVFELDKTVLIYPLLHIFLVNVDNYSTFINNIKLSFYIVGWTSLIEEWWKLNAIMHTK